MVSEVHEHTLAPDVCFPYISLMLDFTYQVSFQKSVFRRQREDGREVRCGDHLPPHKYIRNTSAYGMTPIEHLLKADRRPQTSKKAN